MTERSTTGERPGDGGIGVHRIIVMGVTRCGKSTVGALLAGHLGGTYLDGDELHPHANNVKMAAGQPLDDDDRGPWLREIGEHLVAATTVPALIIGCSALMRSYRDLIRVSVPETVFVHLRGSRKLLTERMEARPGHFMPASLLDSQLTVLQALEPEEAGRAFTIDLPPERIAVDAARWLEARLKRVS